MIDVEQGRATYTILGETWVLAMTPGTNPIKLLALFVENPGKYLSTRRLEYMCGVAKWSPLEQSSRRSMCSVDP